MIGYLAQKQGGSIKVLKAIKLVWLSDRLSLWQYGHTITGDQYVALPYGPAPSRALNIVDKERWDDNEDEIEYGAQYIKRVDVDIFNVVEPNLKILSKLDIQVLNTIYNIYGSTDRWELSEFSHKFWEWDRHKDKAEARKAPKMDILDFFTAVEGEATFGQLPSEEELRYLKEIHLSSNPFQKYLG